MEKECEEFTMKNYMQAIIMKRYFINTQINAN